MLGFFIGHPQPIRNERGLLRGRQTRGKSQQDIAGQIDGVQLDMRQGMQQRDAAGSAAGLAALGHVAGWQQSGSVGPARAIRRHQRRAQRQRLCPPCGGQCAAEPGFLPRISGQKYPQGAGIERPIIGLDGPAMDH